MQRRASSQRQCSGREDSNGSAEKGRSYVADEEIRLIFFIGDPATQRSGMWLGNIAMSDLHCTAKQIAT